MAFPGSIVSKYSLDGVIQPYAYYAYSEGGFSGSGASQYVWVQSLTNPDGYQFDGWTFSGVVPTWSGSTSARYVQSELRGSTTPSGTLTAIANFKSIKYKVTTKPNKEAYGTTAPSYVELSPNSSCTITATAAIGYKLVRWVSNFGVNVTQNPYTFNVTSDIEWTAYFSPYTNLILRDKNNNIILRKSASNVILRDSDPRI